MSVEKSNSFGAFAKSRSTPPLIPSRFLMGAVAHNQHVQNLAGALYEMNALAAFHTAGADHWTGFARPLRKLAGVCWPGLDDRLGRRRISTIPERLVTSHWKWELLRLLAGKGAHKPLIEDWLWEKNETELDRTCARLLETAEFNAFLGVEHGALASLKAAKALGKLSVVAFLSPHHTTREKWEDAEYYRFPALMTETRKVLLEKGRARDARRDEEASEADIIHCASEFTRHSLMQVGVDPGKTICVPLGCPDPMTEPLPSGPAPEAVRFLYSGPVSVRKGAHLLVAAWKTAGLKKQAAATKNHAELHFYGHSTMPPGALDDCGDNVIFHGNVTKAQITTAYRQAGILVFPTLCDGFGMVVAEAFANGLPVITTPNAGAVDLIVEGRNGFIVPPGDTEALAQRLAWCASHPQEVFAMREAALNTARGWGWREFRESFKAQLLDRVLAHTARD